MTKQTLPPEFLERLAAVKKKRAKAVIEHILEHGHVTTEELRTLYEYHHPPRGARDVREEGIPLDTFRVNSSSAGRRIGAYRFADPSRLLHDRVGGRKAIPKKFRTSLIKEYGSKCNACSGNFEGRYLQVDHRVPYEVGGDAGAEARDVQDYQLLDGSCNRAKSWSCEHCPNLLKIKDPKICTTCYWGSPEDYRHVATRNLRRLDVTFDGDEVGVFDELQKQAQSSDVPVPDLIKSILKAYLKD